MAMRVPSAKQRNAATAQKHPAFGGADRINLVGKCSSMYPIRNLEDNPAKIYLDQTLDAAGVTNS
jgi:hypothetical protein